MLHFKERRRTVWSVWALLSWNVKKTSAVQLECRGLHSLVKAEKGNADVTAGTGDLSWQAKRKKFSKRKEKTQKNPLPIFTACQHEQNLQPAEAFRLLGLGCCPAGLGPHCFLFGARPLWWDERGCENQADPEGRLSKQLSWRWEGESHKEWKHEREKEGQMQPG